MVKFKIAVIYGWSMMVIPPIAWYVSFLDWSNFGTCHAMFLALLCSWEPSFEVSAKTLMVIDSWS
jgi:hypothetical protein